MPKKRKRGAWTKKGGGRKKRTVAVSDDEEMDNDPLISGKWHFNVTAKITDPKFDKPELIEILHGRDLNLQYVKESGLQKPIFIENTDGLYINKFGVDDVRRLVGGERLIEVVEVATQKSRKMPLKDFVKYYKTPAGKRKELLNVLSLEFSLTKLEDYVKAPGIVKEIDWVERLWPEALKAPQDPATSDQQTKVNYPKVQNYCLMSVEGCYTDFHVDFGGTSVWYHVLRGEKVFWMIPPTETNFKLYEAWTLSGVAQDGVFFGDVVEHTHRVHLKAGQTFFIPAGWIHAVYTVEDSLVFGGNFLHSYAIPIQLRVHKLECNTHVGNKYRYPYFVPILWYVACEFLEKLCGRKYLSEEKVMKEFLGEPAKEDTSHDDTHPFRRPPTPADWNMEEVRGLSEGEVEGLKELSKWFTKLHSSNYQVPYGILRPLWLLRDLKEKRKMESMDETIDEVISNSGSLSEKSQIKAELSGWEEKKPRLTEEEGVWTGFDPMSSLVRLGDKPLPSALRQNPAIVSTKRTSISILKPEHLNQKSSGGPKASFDFAQLAFSSDQAWSSVGLKSILKAKAGTLHSEGQSSTERRLPSAATHNAPPTYSSPHISSYVSPRSQAASLPPLQGRRPPPPIPPLPLPLPPPLPLDIVSPGGGPKAAASALSPDQTKALEELTRLESDFKGDGGGEGMVEDEESVERSEEEASALQTSHSLFTPEQLEAVNELQSLTQILMQT